MSDDTPQKNVTTPDTAGAADDTKKGSEYMIPKSRFDEVNNAKKAAEEQAQQYQGEIERLKQETKIAEARGKYWEDVVNSETVQNLMKEHPTLSVEQVIKLSGVTTDTKAAEPNQNFEAILGGARQQPEPPKELSLEEEIALVQSKVRGWEITL